MQEKILDELIYARIHVGPVFALVRIQENILEELFLKYVFALWPCPLYWHSACIRTSLGPIHKNISGELISVQIHAAHVFTPGRIQENIPGELFMYWFRARGYLYMGKMGSICHFPRALPASIWGHCSQVLVVTSIWGVQKGCNSDTLRAVFPSIGVSYDP